MNPSKTINAPQTTLNVPSPWPHWLAWLVACGVFPLIWMGGLTTTRKAGMAVPDWPTTFDHWFYPLQKWLWNVSSDLFLEHGHRTIAQLVGLASIFLLVAVFRCDGRKSVRWLTIFILGGLLFQGTLGGFRVLWDERLLARLHGCTAPIVFCLCTIMVAMTSTAWRNSASQRLQNHRATRPLRWLSALLAVGIYLEIVFGTQLRHPLPDTWPGWFPLWIWSKVITASLLVVGMIFLLTLARKKLSDLPALRRRAYLLASLFFLQLIFAGTTWVANYGWPKWFSENILAVEYTVMEKGLLQVWITTAHAAVGSLVLASAVNFAVWTRRLLQGRSG